MPKFTSSYGFKNWPKPFAPELDTQIVSLSAKVKKSGRRSGKPPTPLVDPDCRLGAFETTVIQPPCPVQYPVSEGERRWMDAEIEELLASIKREVDGCEPRPVVPGSRTDRSQLESGEILDDQPPQQADRQISHQGVKRRAENEPSGPAKCPRRIRWPDHFAMMSYEPRLGKKLYGGPRLERMYLDQQEPYTPVKRLGTGGQGTAHLVKNQRTGSVVVCKVIPHLRSHGYRDSELFFLRDALPPHARIINLQSALTSPYQTQLYLDYCTGGDLASFIESHHYKLTGASVPEAFIWHAFLQLSEALAFIHHGHDRARKRPLEPWRAVIHRDVKPANILLQRAAFDPDHPGLEPYPRLVLADFGLALQADAPGALPESTCSVGTFAYQPPECPLHSAKGDVWAAGAIVYEMCTGNVPFDEQLPASVCDAEAFWTWLAGLGKRERWALFAVEGAGYSRALGNVLRKALEVDVRRRVGSVELVGMVEQGSERAGAKWEEIHPWVWKGGEGEEC
ncbi:MAG: hypothetical protein LQ344_006468 [Seirophora lacunosa]|nr:MAG: hypothetical protein LQ344_006468 [Seirophora lacunosa]